MKSLLVILAALALTANVEAAPTKATATKTTKSAKAKKAAAIKKQAAAKKAAQAEEAISSSSEAAITQTARAVEVAPKAPAKRWSLTAFSDIWGAQVSAVNAGTLGKNGNGNAVSDTGIVAGYKIADDMTAAAAFEWGQELGPREASTDTTMYDPSLRLSKSGLIDLGNDMKVNGQARVYLPLSEDSQDREQITQIRFYASTGKDLTKSLSAGLLLSPRVFIQQNDTYINSSGSEKNLDTFRLLTSASLKYSFNDVLALEQTFGLYQKWKTNTPRADYLDASTYVTVVPASWLEFNLGIRQSDGSTDTRKTGLSGLYNDDQTEYFMITTLSI